jgi:hypothetical protein
MATWDIVIPAGSTQGSGSSNSTALSPTVPGDFDGATINSVSVVGSPTATVDGTPTDDTIGVRWHIETSTGTAVWGGTGSDAASACFVTIDTSVTSSGTIADGSAPSPAPSTGVSADWDNTDYLVTYLASMKNDGETISWSSFTLQVDYSPNVNTDLSGGPGVGSYSLSGAATTTLVSEVLNAGTDSYTLSGAAVTTLVSEVLNAGTDSYSLSGAAVTTSKAIVSDAGAGSYALSGAAVTTSSDRISFDNVAFDESNAFDINAFSIESAGAATTTLNANAGSYALSGAVVNTEHHEVIAAAAGSYTLTGQAVTTLVNEVLNAGVGSYTLTGQAVNTEEHEVLAAATGSYSLTGQGVTTTQAVKTDAGAGSYALTGQPVTTSTATTQISFDFLAFDERNAFDVNAFSIEAEAVATATAASYALTGQAVSTYYNPADIAGVGTYTLSGAEVTTNLSVTHTTAGAGSYTLTGQTANTEVATLTTVGAGSYTLTGADVRFEPFRIVGTGSYELRGRPTTGVVVDNISFDNAAFANEAFDADNAFSMLVAGDIRLDAGTGSYTLTGQDVFSVASGELTTMAAQDGSYTLSGATLNTYPQTGWTAFPFTVDWSGLDPDSPFYGVPELITLDAGDICIFENTTTPDGYSVTMDGTGVFTVGTVPDVVNTFDYFIYDGAPGTTETITILPHGFLSADAGSYTLTGADVTTGVSAVAGVGSYTLTGQPIGTQVEGDELITAGAGSYSLTGQPATVQKDNLLAAGTGAYTLTGADAPTIVADIIPIIAESGSYSLTGQPVTLIETGDKETTAGAGSYTLTGQDVVTSIGAAVEEQPSGGYEFWDDFAAELERRKREKERRRKAREKAKRIQDELDRELALAQRALEEEEARIAELARINRLVANNKSAIIDMGNPKIIRSMNEALERQTFSTMERLERELNQMYEEEAFLLQAALILVNQ